MHILALTNVAAWSLQAALVIASGAIALRLLRIDAPVIRHACWRALLVVTLLLPFAQTRHTEPAARFEAINAPASGDLPSSIATRTLAVPEPALTTFMRGLRGRWPWVVS